MQGFKEVHSCSPHSMSAADLELLYDKDAAQAEEAPFTCLRPVVGRVNRMRQFIRTAQQRHREARYGRML